MLATDGVWDVMKNEEAIALASSATPSQAAAEVVRQAASRWDQQMPGRRDDVTAVVADLAHPDLQTPLA